MEIFIILPGKWNQTWLTVSFFAGSQISTHNLFGLASSSSDGSDFDINDTVRQEQVFSPDIRLS